MKNGEIDINGERKFCTLMRKRCYLLEKKKYVCDNRANSGHWKPMLKTCSEGIECKEDDIDCMWAVGTGKSQNDPMEDW